MATSPSCTDEDNKGRQMPSSVGSIVYNAAVRAGTQHSTAHYRSSPCSRLHRECMSSCGASAKGLSRAATLRRSLCYEISSLRLLYHASITSNEKDVAPCRNDSAIWKPKLGRPWVSEHLLCRIQSGSRSCASKNACDGDTEQSGI